MKKDTSIRLFVVHPLSPGGQVPLTPDQSLYVQSVMRCQTGDTLLVFNGRDGEFRARLEGAKKGAHLHVETLTRPQAMETGPHLYFAPIKRKRLEMLVEKVTELGVASLTPVITQHAAVREVNPNRLRAIAIEAAEQCERMTVPNFQGEVSFQELLESYEGDYPLLVCDERGGEDLKPITQVSHAPERSLLIGPEGGFSEQEFANMKQSGKVEFVSLGTRILRAETAAILGVGSLMLKGYSEKS